MLKSGFSKVPTYNSETTHVIIRLDGFLDILKMSNFQIHRKVLPTPFLKSHFAALCFESRFFHEKRRCITFWTFLKCPTLSLFAQMRVKSRFSHAFSSRCMYRNVILFYTVVYHTIKMSRMLMKRCLYIYITYRSINGKPMIRYRNYIHTIKMSKIK